MIDNYKNIWNPKYIKIMIKTLFVDIFLVILYLVLFLIFKTVFYGESFFLHFANLNENMIILNSIIFYFVLLMYFLYRSKSDFDEVIDVD